MRCKHTDGIDWSHAVLDKRNGGWRVKCLSCGQTVVTGHYVSSVDVKKHTMIYGAKEHMSKKERLKRKKEEVNAERS